MGTDCSKHLIQGRHWTHKRLLPVSMVTSWGTGGSPTEKFARNWAPVSSAITPARISSDIRFSILERK